MGKKMGVYGLEHKRNRLAGKIEQYRLANRNYLLKIERMHKQYATNEDKIRSLQSTIDLLTHAAATGFDTALDKPVPRRTVPKRHMAPWGQISREVLTHLRLANGKSISTVEITSKVRNSLSLTLSSSEYSHLRKQFSNALWRMFYRGTVTRVEVALMFGESTTWSLAVSA